VVGIEGDIQWTDQKDSITSAGVFSGSAFSTFDCFGDVDWPCTVTGTAASTLATKINWFGTLRARFGIAADQFLFYGTGGFAYGRVRTSGIASFSGTYMDTGGPCDPSGPGACSASGSAAFADSATRLGWAAGAGIESCMPFVGNWTWRLEYLFVDLGTINTTTAYSSSFVVGTLLPPLFAQTAYQSLTHGARVTDNIVRFGLNYRFGGGVPVVASY
jgi:outer membrane immunogenic protein